MPTCPNCKTELNRKTTPQGIVYSCYTCKGKAIGLGVLRKASIDQAMITEFWSKVMSDQNYGTRPCPHCGKTMIQILRALGGVTVALDICKSCQSFWFDKGEPQSMPDTAKKKAVKEKELSPKAKEALAKFQIRERHKQDIDMANAEFYGRLIAEILAGFQISGWDFDF